MNEPTQPRDAIAFALDRHRDRLRVVLDGAAHDGGPLDARLPETLVAGLEAVLQTRAWPAGIHRLRLDRGGQRRLGVRHRDGGIEISLLDQGDRRLAPAARSTLTAFGRAIERFVVDETSRLLEDASTPPYAPDASIDAVGELVRWAEALDRGDRRAAEDGERPDLRPRRRRPSREAVEALPVAGLHHLAYRRAWRREAPGLCGVAAVDDELVIFDDDGMWVLERATGAVRWQHPDLRPVDGPAPARYALDADGAPVALARDGQQRWRGDAPTDAPIRRIQPTRRRVLAIAAGHVFALDAADGRPRWRYAIHYGEIVGLTARGEMAWLAGEDGFLHGLRVESGEERFAIALDGEPEGSPRLNEHGLVLGINREPDRSARILCLDPTDGARRWMAEVDGSLVEPPSCAADRIAAVVDDGMQVRVALLDAETGAIRWQRALDGGPGTRAQLIDDTVYVKSIDGAVDALDPRDGALRWRVEGDDPDLSLRRNTPLIACRGLLLLPGTLIRALDPADGRQVHVLDCGELVPDWLHVWPEGDLAIAEDEAVARYLLGGHLALVA